MPGPRSALARTFALLAPVVALAGLGCSADREASSAPPLETLAVPGSVPAGPGGSADVVVDVEHVAMVGDSITVGSEEQLRTAFAAIGFPVVEIDAESGRRMVRDGGIPSGLEGIADVLEEGEAPDLWVVALGTNDIANYAVEEYPAAIEELLAAIPDEVPVVWVDCYLEDYQDESIAFADTLRQVLADRGDASVVDWRSVAGDDGVLTDGVHPSESGRVEFAHRVATGVQAWTS